MEAFLIHSAIIVVKIAVVFGMLLTSVPVLVLVERKVLGWMQARPGPNRVGPWGLLQTTVDGLKVFFKENVVPDGVEPLTYRLAPILTAMPAFIVGCVIPFGPPIEVGGYRVTLSVADLDYSLLFFFAVASLSVYGIVLAGWSSNNKWSLLGGLRSSAQMVSYEISLSLAVVGILLIDQTFSLRTIAEKQTGGFWRWNVFAEPLAFVLFFISGIAEANRAPFDLPEAESELTGGYLTEYSGMRFVMFYMSEYVSLFIMSVVIATLFLGGFNPPYPHEFGTAWYEGLTGFVWLMAKVGCLFFIFVWMRATLPRLRYDELMSLGWKVMLPLAFINVALTAVLVAFDRPWWELGLLGLAALVGADVVLTRVLWRRRRAG